MSSVRKNEWDTQYRSRLKINFGAESRTPKINPAVETDRITIAACLGNDASDLAEKRSVITVAMNEWNVSEPTDAVTVIFDTSCPNVVQCGLFC